LNEPLAKKQREGTKKEDESKQRKTTGKRDVGCAATGKDVEETQKETHKETVLRSMGKS